VHLAEGAPGSGLAAGDLPQAHRLALARPLGDLQRHEGVGKLVFLRPSAVSVQVTVVNAEPGRSATGPLR
jgi:hypothetical protein